MRRIQFARPDQVVIDHHCIGGSDVREPVGDRWRCTIWSAGHCAGVKQAPEAAHSKARRIGD